jgi:hypothetical protein
MNKYMVTLSDVQSVRDRRDVPNLLRKMNAEKICEVGVKEGANFNTLLVSCVKHAVAIDIWSETGVRSQNDDWCSVNALDKQYKNMLSLANRDNRVEVIKDFSLNAISKFDDEYFDFVYIDADHTESAVYADLCAWWSKVRSGGILAGHDYCKTTLNRNDEFVQFGVIPAVDRFVAENNLSLYVDNEIPWHDWFISKL